MPQLSHLRVLHVVLRCTLCQLDKDRVVTEVDVATGKGAPFQAPEVAIPLAGIYRSRSGSAEVDYSKAHPWSCAALMLHYINSAQLPTGTEFSTAVLQKHLEAASFIAKTGHAKTDRQGGLLLKALGWMLTANPGRRPSATVALAHMESIHERDQHARDFDNKYRSQWSSRRQQVLSGDVPSASPLEILPDAAALSQGSHESDGT